MKLLTLAQAAVLVLLTVFGAYAAHDTTRTAADPACLTQSDGTCAR
ncbi:hypothetical protein ROJ8625_01372 [Roseivivax jejudonensis]|uniref:Uncharacterized protein n=1 Tax=Roseivivax jejudonensis TaxID=1529041 RepID=A0A1X6YT49_9RHOB|nr:hypothetical protein [Roseivivax jejudonensis]SLN30574.1 hypothetical protein ROJ8625_01372 [Roseivivax jejudonensis]